MNKKNIRRGEIYLANLEPEHNARVLRQTGAARERIHVNGKPVRNALCGNRRSYRRAAVLVTLVVLDYENRTDSALFAADHGT